MKFRAYGTNQLSSFSLFLKNNDIQFWKAVKLNFLSKIHEISWEANLCSVYVQTIVEKLRLLSQQLHDFNYNGLYKIKLSIFKDSLKTLMTIAIAAWQIH